MKATAINIKLGKTLVMFTLNYDSYGWSVVDSNDSVMIEGGIYNCKRDSYLAPLTIKREVYFFSEEIIEMVKKAMKKDLPAIIKERRF